MRYFRWALGVLVALVVAGSACQGWAYLNYRSAQRALSQGDLATAQHHLARCLKVWFLSADTYLLAGRTARRAGDFDGAASYLRESRALGGAEPAINLEYKLLSVQQGELAASRDYLIEQMRQQGPETPLIAEVLAAAFVQAYQIDDALTCVEHWLEYEPDRADAWGYRARLYALLQNDEQALASYRRLVQLAPENDEARLQLAQLLLRRYQAREALEHFELLRRRERDIPEVLCGLAGCKRQLNQPDEARRLLERVLDQEPQNLPALTERARLDLEFEIPG